MQDKWKFFQNLKLYSKIKKDTLNCIDIDGKTILYFETPYHLIDAFVKKRLVIYQKRKTRTIEILNADINQLTDKIKFITLVVEDKIIINKRKIYDIKLDLQKYDLSTEMLKMNIDKLTIEEIEKMQNKKQELTQYLEYIKITSIQEMYVNDLVEFKEKYCTIYK
jgi:hypothetical protein